MSNQFDILEQALSDALEEPSLFTDEDFIMNIFNAAVDTTPEFAEFKQCNHDEKTLRVVDSNQKLVPSEILFS